MRKILLPATLCLGLLLTTLSLTAGAASSPSSFSPPPPPTQQECIKEQHTPCMTPALMRAYYGVDALAAKGITGKGQSIAIIVSFGSPTLRQDVDVFDKAFNLPPIKLDILAPLGAKHPSPTGWEGETTLDVEWAHAIAPDAHIVVLESPVDETEGIQGMPQFLTLEEMVLKQHLANVISQSWSATEETLFDPKGRALIDSFHRFYAAASAAGITAVAASGDEGAAGPDLSVSHMYPFRVVGYPASDPLVLSVGGTRLGFDGNGQIIDETTWTNSGGGLSKLFPEPDYQRLLAAPAQHILNGRRGLPDVSYNASLDSATLIYTGGRWVPTGGTSAGAPQWAGLVALADDQAGHGLGSINATLYQLAVSPRYAAVLRNITTGAIVGPSSDGSSISGIAYRAGPGWNAATGLGSPRADALIPALASASRSSASSVSPKGGN